MKTLSLTLLLALGCVAPLGCSQECSSTNTEEVASNKKTATVEKTVVLGVKGMTCSGCVNAIVTKVDQLPGVVSCDVSLDNQRAEIELSDASAEPRVEEAIRKLGYTVEPESTKPAS